MLKSASSAIQYCTRTWLQVYAFRNTTRRRLEEHRAAHQGCSNSTFTMKNRDILRTTVIEKDDDAVARARAQYTHNQNSAMQLKVMQLNKMYG